MKRYILNFWHKMTKAKRNLLDKPREDQRMNEVTVDVKGVEYREN
jgi:hypothetical protein